MILAAAAHALSVLLVDLPAVAGLFAEFDVSDGVVVLREACALDVKARLDADAAKKRIPVKAAVTA